MMVSTHGDRLIDTGARQAHMLGLTALLMLTGLLYVAFVLPPYDPGVLSQPAWLTYGEYLGLFLGGLAVFVAFILPDRILTLRGQFIGLAVQTLAAATLVATVAWYGGASGLFIIVFGLLVVAMHSVRLTTIWHDLRQAPERRRVGEKFTEPGTADILSIIQFLESRNAELERRLR